MFIWRKIILIFIFIISLAHADFGPQKYTGSSPKTVFKYMEYKDAIPFNREDLRWEAQSQNWQKQMSGLTSSMKVRGVKSVYFVHGTFVGRDPFGVVEYLKKIYPGMDKELEQTLYEIIKSSNDVILEDTANFTKEYTDIFSRAMGPDVSCHRFLWSSGSHHWARVKASILLTKSIAEEISQKNLSSDDKILLIGHSHAGQLFALLTNYLSETKGSDTIFDIAQEGGVEVSEIKIWLEQIRKVQLDVVTYGTPALYGWGKKEKYRLLNMINHRGKNHLAGELNENIFFTLDGDYIQQVGITGSGSESLNPWEQILNEKLYPLLGPENDEDELQKNLVHRMRVPQYGKTLLIDYKDNSDLFPNCITTLFGHGVNTLYDTMLFNTKVIVDEFYSEEQASNN